MSETSCSFEAEYFDGRSARAHAVILHIADGELHWSAESAQGRQPLVSVRWDPVIGQTHALIHLPDGGVFRVHDRRLGALWKHAEGDVLERWAGLIEGRMRFVLAALVLAAGMVYSGLRWGVPVAAQQVAAITPAAMEATLGRQSLAILDRVFSASQLPAERQQALVAQLKALCLRTKCPAYQLEFRQGGRIGANALALPGGTMVMTDELVKLAQHDEEILAVLVHELGHVQERHGLRMALQTMGAGAILVVLTGDLGSVSDLASGLPAVLLQSGYSRTMEREADDHAWRSLNESCIAPQRFADILRRLDRHPSETGLLDSHPGTAERIRQFSHPSVC